MKNKVEKFILEGNTYMFRMSQFLTECSIFFSITNLSNRTRSAVALRHFPSMGSKED